MTVRLASLLAPIALCAAAWPALAQDWGDEGPQPRDALGPAMREGHGPMARGHREIGRLEFRHHGGNDRLEGHKGAVWDRPMPPPGPMMMPPPLPGAPGPVMSYVYPSPYPAWVYPPVVWVKVPIVREHSAGCGCEQVAEETVITREFPRPLRRVHHRREPGKWVRYSK